VRLPTFQELSKEQDAILNLPLEGNFLVSGPPGTGKTVMALYRAHALDVDERPTRLLMHGNVLSQYTRLAAQGLGIEATVATFHSWFGSLWRKQYHRKVPTVRYHDPWAFDWASIRTAFMSSPPPANMLEDVLVDEGQDLSLDFYRIIQWLARNITVFADENQKLFDDNSTLEEIEKNLGSGVEHYRLTRNYRNTREVALLAREFYCGASTGIPDLPEDRRGDKPLLRRFPRMYEFIDYVVRYHGTWSDYTIGIVCPSKKVQQKVLNRLSDKGLAHKPLAYMSDEPDHKSLDFESPGIKIVHYRSVKGLEFDAVFAPELQQIDKDPTSADLRMTMYVVASRARRALEFSFTGDGPEPGIVASISADLLERR
jgi:superfamily I DNA/RNA helicase